MNSLVLQYSNLTLLEVFVYHKTVGQGCAGGQVNHLAIYQLGTGGTFYMDYIGMCSPRGYGFSFFSHFGHTGK